MFLRKILNLSPFKIVSPYYKTVDLNSARDYSFYRVNLFGFFFRANIFFGTEYLLNVYNVNYFLRAYKFPKIM